MTTTPDLRHCARCKRRLAVDNPQAMCGTCQRAAVDARVRPPEVPPEFWTLDQMSDALATWHMGRVIYAYRTHPHHPQTLPQEVVGAWLGLTQAQLSRIENGRAPEELTKLIRYSQILGIPAELLWFDRPGEPRTRAAGGSQAPVLTVPVIVGGQQVALPIDRAAAHSHGLTDLLAELASDSGEVGAPQVPMPRGERAAPGAAHVVPLASIEEMQHLAAAMQDAGRYLDETVVGFFGQQFTRCKANDGQMGPLRALPLVLGVLDAIQSRARDVRPQVRRALLSVGADGAEFAGWLYRDLHDATSAAYWYDRAMEWAQEAGDLPMQGYILLRKSQAAYEDRDAARVLTLAQAARYGPWQLPPRVQAEATQQEARGLAMVGDSFTVVEERLDEAHALLGAADDDPDCLGAGYDEGTWLLRSATCYIEAGKPGRAAALYGEVLATGVLSRRDEGYYRARRAVAHALGGEPDDAAEEGLTALRLATATGSSRTTRELTRAAQILTPWQTRPGPRQLRAALLV